MAYKFPWTNYHELNLDWILNTVKELFAKTEQNNSIVEQYDGRLTEVELTADNAQTASGQALENSTAALDLAQNAQTTATQAQQAAGQAQQAAGQAQTAAGQALEAAATAQQTATQAQQTAQNFDGRITQAENNAANALQAAQAFDEQVQGAITAANNANEAATTALTKSTETERELAAQRSTLEGIVSDGVESLQESAQNATEEIEALGQSVLDSIPADYTTLSELVDKKADVIYNTAAGEIASFNDGADDMKIKRLVVNIEPVQAGSGDPSPNNVRPISGRTAAGVLTTGVNIWDEVWEIGSIDSFGMPTPGNNDTIRSKNYIPCKPNTQYYISPYSPASAPAIYAIFMYDINKNYISLGPINNNILSTGSNVYYLKFRTYVAYGTVYKNDITINYPALDTSYHAYTGNQIVVMFPTEAGTVYEGTPDIIKGVLPVHSAYNEWTGAQSETYTRDTGDYGYRFRRAYPDADQTPGRKSVLCNRGVFSGGNAIGTVFLNAGQIYYYPPSSVTTVEEFKTWLSANNLQFVYPLATPVEYQLTPQQVKTLYQYNNIWSDAGSVNVEYPADTKTYIDNKFAELQALILEH